MALEVVPISVTVSSAGRVTVDPWVTRISKGQSRPMEQAVWKSNCSITVRFDGGSPFANARPRGTRSSPAKSGAPRPNASTRASGYKYTIEATADGREVEIDPQIIFDP